LSYGIGDSQVQLTWETGHVFKLLGVACFPAFSKERGKKALTLDTKAFEGCLYAICAPFKLRQHQNLVHPVMLRQGIEQIFYGKALYPTPLLDVAYDSLQRLAVGAARRVLQLQPRTPTAFIQWELRLWPPHLRAHKRAMTFMAFLMHHSWVGEKILRPYLEAGWGDQDREAHDVHPIFDVPPLRRMTNILKLYNLSWLTVYSDWKRPWALRASLASKIEQDHLLPAFLEYIHMGISSGSKGIPNLHRRQLLRDMALPAAPTSEKAKKEAVAVARLLPLYLFVPDDLPTAGIRFRAPYLRLQHRGSDKSREPCAWCLAADSEYGYHLLRCRQAPIRIMALRLRALRLIQQDYQSLEWVPEGDPDSEVNLARLFSLSWRGSAAWQPNRRDKGHQPSLEVLQAALLYMREAINEYAGAVAGTGPGGSDPVWKLPIYLKATEPVPEELAAVTLQQLLQPNVPEMGAALPELDSLQRLGNGKGPEAIIYTSDDEEVDMAQADDGDAENGPDDADEPGNGQVHVRRPATDPLQALGASDDERD
jgi:hypothetical protein